MKNKLISFVANTLVKVGVAYDGSVSPNEFYQPTKPNKKSK